VNLFEGALNLFKAGAGFAGRDYINVNFLMTSEERSFFFKSRSKRDVKASDWITSHL
jgi:hypothetical protein